ncbi:MAG: FHA domain-containing protein [Lachnospiraceae bacterium]|nr:FHA domain-containing protein [Lachnospiraceae bacterium]
MNITFKRDLSRSYMVVSGSMEPSTYEEGMLRNNDVFGLLSFHTTQVNGQIQYWYDITGKRSLKDYLSQEKVTRENLKVILQELNAACRKVSDYLIRQEHILFTADSIFVENTEEGPQLFLCYCPLRDKNIYNEFLTITEHLITEVDHQDEELRQVCYDLYEASLSSDFSLMNAYEYVKVLETPREEYVSESPVYEDYQDRCVQIRREAYEEETRVSDEEEDSILVRIHTRLLDWKNKVFHRVTDKRKELFPLPSESEDFIFDAEDVCEPKTQMLSEIQQPPVSRLVYEGKGKAPEIILEDDVISIGSKSGENSVVLPFSGVSRYHARIRKVGEEFRLEDLNSTNGTYCNGQILSYHEPHTLQRMDQVMFADVAYRVV